MNKRIDILVGTKDRPTEVALLLQSLRTQTYQDWDLYVLDDAGGSPITNYYFVKYIINRIKLEGHVVKLKRNSISFGISKMRQQMVEWSEEETNNPYICRLDDDVILEPDYIERLVKVIEEHGYDIASGVTPPMAQPEWKRDTKFVKPFINDIKFDDKGNITYNGDDCGYGFIQGEVIPTPHFRSCAVYKREIHKHSVDYHNNLTKNGYREEQFMSFKAIMNGFKIGVDTGAVVLHLLTPSGGHRTPDYNELIQLNEKIFLEWTKKQFEKHGNFVESYKEKFK